jgi:eukaryotic-like serine/threonine-protein kinase
VLVDPIRGFGFLTQELLLALESGEPRRVALGLCHYATNLGTAGQAAYPRATQLLAQAHAIGERLDDPFVLGTAGNCQAAVEMCAGHWRATVSHVTRANDILRQRCNGAWWEINSGFVFAEVALSLMGRLHELAGLIQSEVRIALDRGDLFAATSSRLQRWYASLAADDVSQAGAEIRDAIGRWTQRGFHTNHFWALYGETQCELYEGKGAAARERLSRAWPLLSSSTILRIQFLRMLITLQRGTAAVAAAHARQGDARQLLREAEKDASRLAKERAGWADAAASLLRASILGARGRPEESLRHLDQAMRGFDAADMALYAACARRRKGQLLGGEEGQRLIEAAEAAMREQGITNPARWTALYAPGFSDGSRA